MIVDVKKYLFIGVKEDIEHFFERAQQKGFLEFIPANGKKAFQFTPAIDCLTQALRILRKQPLGKMEEKREGREDALRIAEEVITLKAEAETIAEQIRVIQADIVRVGPLGDFQLEDLSFIEEHGHRTIRFFCMKSAKRDEMKDHDELLYLGTEYDLDYYMSLSKSPIRSPLMMEMKIDLPVGALREKLRALEKHLHKTESQLKKLVKEMNFLHEVLIEELNGYHLAVAKNGVAYPSENSLFVIEAWVPKNKVHSLFAMLQGMAVHAEAIVTEKSDRVPTYMENKGLGKVGEDLVHIYDTPATDDKDPSRWVLWSFCLFFAMIIADAGYGLLFLALAIFVKIKVPHLKGSGQRFIKLLGLLSISCIIWGALTTSYFGISILPSNILSRISMVSYLAEKKADYHLSRQDKVYKDFIHDYPELATAKTGQEILQTPVHGKKKGDTYPILEDFSSSILLELSLLIGVLHIGLSLIRYLGRNWAGLGWVIFMAGGYFYFPSIVQATSLLNFMGWISPTMATDIGIQMIYIGIALASTLAIVQKRFKGLTEVMNVIAVFADVLSYLRLYALSLAATIMADTFNEIGVEIGLALGVVVILAGHSVNLLLGTMGGVIHGLRLNFIEWYHYSFEGGGRLFAPLQKLKR
ncbi:MAG: hypothetical protein KGZ30_03295 [Anaplasmataceae bacterium]|nr:hypothetical protein [Anaplasmataceae bacterium]